MWGLLLALACVEPTTEALVGSWSNEDAGTVRRFTFAGSGDVFELPELAGSAYSYGLYVHDAGAAPTLVQAGTYSVQDDVLVNDDAGEPREMNDVLVQTVLWSIDGAGVGASFGDPIYAFSPAALTLRSATAASGRRRFDAVDVPP